MRTIAGVRETVGFNTGFAADTTFVLFFLALEFGRSLTSFGFDGFLLGLSLGTVMVLPYFLLADTTGQDFGRWLAGRGVIAAFGTIVGLGFDQIPGVVLPDSIRYLPMTFLIVSATISCFIQFYGILRFRPAK